MKFILSFTIFLFIAINVQARCNGNWGDHVLAAHHQSCGVDFYNEVHQNQELNTAISNICMEGCYSAFVNPTLEAECDIKYRAVFDEYKDHIAQATVVGGCDKSSSQSAAPAPDRSADKSCRWLSRHTVDLKCGGQRNTNICGVGGRTICTGKVICKDEFEALGQKVRSGSYDVSCLSKSGRCTSIPISECMSDTHTQPHPLETHYDESIRGAVRSSVKEAYK